MMMAGGLVSPARHRGKATAHVPHCRQRFSGCDYVGKACVAGKGALVSTGAYAACEEQLMSNSNPRYLPPSKCATRPRGGN